MADVTSPFAFPYPEDTDLVRDGATDIENLATGVNDYLAGGYLYAGTVYFTSSGTFAKADPLETGDIGLRAIRVRVVGGGGGGGGAAATTATEAAVGGNGGGGGYSEAFITDIASLDASVTVTRGAGGSGAASGANAGSTGATSSFGALVVATGGSGGGGGTAGEPPFGITGTGGGVGTSGDLLISGGHAAGFTQTLTTLVRRQITGSSQLGPGIYLGVSNTDGGAGAIHGGGATGGSNVANQASTRTGGAGGNGIVIVDCFV
jgi:hypothetical protein